MVRDSTAATDGITVIAAIGGGNWLRLDPAPEAWGLQTSWYVDSIIGNDEATGLDSSHPIKTHIEYERRTGDTPITTNINVYLLGSITEAITIRRRNGQIPGTPDIYLNYYGAMTPWLSGTLTGATARNPATNQANEIVDASVADWTPYIGQIIEIPTKNCTGVVLKNLGAGRARISQFWDTSNPALYVEVNNITVGDGYQIQSRSQVADVRFEGQSHEACHTYVYNLEITSTSCKHFACGPALFQGCCFAGDVILYDDAFITFSCCWVAGVLGAISGFVQTWGGAANALSAEHTSKWISNGFTVQGIGSSADRGYAYVYTDSELRIKVNGLGIFDCTIVSYPGAITIQAMVNVYLNGPIYGNVGVGTNYVFYAQGATIEYDGVFANLFFATGAAIKDIGFGYQDTTGTQQTVQKNWADIAAIGGCVECAPTLLFAGITGVQRQIPAANGGLPTSGTSLAIARADHVHPDLPPTSSLQAGWYVDSIAGSDTNSGLDASHALKTLSEWSSRTRRRFRIPTTLTILNNVPNTDPLPAMLQVDEGATLTIQGVQTEVENGQIGLYAAPIPATHTPGRITKAAGDWSADVGLLVYITERAAWTRVVKDIGGGAHDCYILPPESYPNNFSSGTLQTPQSNDHYHIYTIPTIYVDRGFKGVGRGSDVVSIAITDLIVRPVDDTYMVLSVDECIALMRCDIMPIGSSCTAAGDNIKFRQCRLGSAGASSPLLRLRCQASTIDGMFLQGTAGSNAKIYGESGGTHGITGAGVIGYNAAIVGNYPYIMLLYSQIAIFNSAGAGLTAYQGTMLYHNGSAAIFGNGNSSYGAIVSSQSQFITTDTSVIYITGSTSDLSVGGAVSLMPDVEAAAGLVLPLASPCTTWAQIKAGPFNGRCFNLNNGAYIGP